MNTQFNMTEVVPHTRKNFLPSSLRLKSFPWSCSSFPVEQRVYFNRGVRVTGDSAHGKMELHMPPRDPLSPLGASKKETKTLHGSEFFPQALISRLKGLLIPRRRRPFWNRGRLLGVGDFLTTALIAALMYGAWIA